LAVCHWALCFFIKNFGLSWGDVVLHYGVITAWLPWVCIWLYLVTPLEWGIPKITALRSYTSGAGIWGTPHFLRVTLPTHYHLREQNVALPRLDSWWSSPSRLYLSSKELESSHQQHTFKYQMFHPLLFIFWFALNVPEVMCRTRCEHLVVSLSNHSFLPPIFKWFFHCIVHQVRFFSSFCPWVVTLHLKPAFGSYKDSPVSLCAWWGNDDLTWCCAK